MIKIAIVGSEEKHWEHHQKLRVWDKIKMILSGISYSVADSEFKNKNPQYQGSMIRYTSLDHGDYVKLISGGCHLGGVDIWAEIIARQMGIECDIKLPEVKQWKDKKMVKGINDDGSYLYAMGFKSRNEEIARECNILYLIDPADREWSGGRWTYEYAAKIGKDVHEMLIE